MGPGLVARGGGLFLERLDSLPKVRGHPHRGKASIERLEGRWPNLIHGPHAHPPELVEQIEIYFSIVQREVLSPNDFESTAEVARTPSAFERRCNEGGEPFEWGFTRDDLTELMDRLAPHEPGLRLAA